MDMLLGLPSVLLSLSSVFVPSCSVDQSQEIGYYVKKNQNMAHLEYDSNNEIVEKDDSSLPLQYHIMNGYTTDSFEVRKFLAREFINCCYMFSGDTYSI